MSREIRAVYTENTIRVYQAYNETIAKEAVNNGTVGKNFKLERMLAIDIKREAFDYLVRNAVISTYHENIHGSYDNWQQLIHD